MALFLSLSFLVSCAQVSTSRNGFVLEAGESRTFSYEGQAVQPVQVKMERGNVVLLFQSSKGEERVRLGRGGRFRLPPKREVTSIVVTAENAASGYIEIRQ